MRSRRTFRPTPRLVDRREAARLLSRSITEIDELRRTGRIVARRYGRKVLFPPAAATEQRDWKESASVESMSPQLLADYGRSCAHVLARAHARSGDRIAIAGYLGNGEAADIAFTRFAEAYARQNDRDYAALSDAVASGRVAAKPGL